MDDFIYQHSGAGAPPASRWKARLWGLLWLALLFALLLCPLGSLVALLPVLK